MGYNYLLHKQNTVFVYERRKPQNALNYKKITD